MTADIPVLQLVEGLSPVGLDREGISPTKFKLIVAGERLIAERGVAGLVLEEVARAATQSNKFAVQYHFKDKAGLVAAIYDLRLRRIAVRRAQLIERAVALGLNDDIAVLLETMAIPLAEQVDDRGTHSYARFWLQMLASTEFDRNAAGSAVPGSTVSNSTADVIGRMGRSLAVPVTEVHRRLYLFGAVVPLTIVDHDNQRVRGLAATSLETALANSVHRVAAAISREI